MRIASHLVGALLASALAACAQHDVQGPAPQGALTPMQVSCPLAQLHGLRATIADTRDGAAITFTAPEEDVDQLRSTVHAMAEANDRQGDPFATCLCARSPSLGSAESMPEVPQESTRQIQTPQEETTPPAAQGEKTPSAPGDTRPSVAVQQPSARAKFEEISTGAVLSLTAKDKKDTAALRSALRANLHALRQNCLGEAAHGE